MTATPAAQRSFTPPANLDPADAAVISGLGYDREVRLLREAIAEWIATASEEMQPQLRWQFLGRSKYFRPLTVFACARAVGVDEAPDEVLRGAMAIELFHNVSLIIDDILDESAERRGVPTLHRRFGLLPALMASGYIVAAGYRLSAGDALSMRLLSELLSRLGVAECLQWRLRREPLGVEDWRLIAGEDTGTMFEVCACMGTRGERLRKFGRLLGMLYHGCDDVGDARGLAALGGGGDEDVRDGILTLPAALAIRDPGVRAAFAKRRPRAAELDQMALAIREQVPRAETYLDDLAQEARAEAFSRAPHPEPLFALIDYTRQLSRR
jgi:geranylgeranyl pyrophosphate synthase